MASAYGCLSVASLPDHSGITRGQRRLGLLVQKPYDDASIDRCTDVMFLNTTGSDGQFPVVTGSAWPYPIWRSGSLTWHRHCGIEFDTGGSSPSPASSLDSDSACQLHSFPSVEAAPEYAALSHRWDPIGEVTFADIRILKRARRMTGWSKIQNACRTARAKGYAWIWIDTCCIDKSSSAELSEAINSMFVLYLNCSICLAYLNDVPASDHPSSPQSAFRSSQWFNRGWTLQELLAPMRTMFFFSRDWTVLGTRDNLSLVIQEITTIDRAVLSDLPETTLSDVRPKDGIWVVGGVPHSPKSDTELLARYWISRIRAHSVAERMSWAARRGTTRPEDMAYSLMGVFDINMPVLYGEGGHKAFRRLQLEIIRQSDDQTIFSWGSCDYLSILDEEALDLLQQDVAYWFPPRLLALSPTEFVRSGLYECVNASLLMSVEENGIRVEPAGRVAYLEEHSGWELSTIYIKV
ncbi:HET-domain-containing protein [Trametes sanguinea]|nr:HET-domain-containing protein [Trametes sanguinea]